MTSRVNRKISVLVADDEPLARAGILSLLSEEVSISRIEQCGSGEEAINLIRKMRFDLLFLDVQMPECDGFDVIEILGSDVPPAVVFTTAFDQHALRAFEAGALDYLLKPFNDDRFWLAFDRAKALIVHGIHGRLESPRKVERLLVKSNDMSECINRDSLDQSQMRMLAEFRFELRKFLGLSEAASAQLGVSMQQYQLMQVIAAKPPEQRASISYLSQRMVLRHNSTVELVDRAERLGLVRREPDKNDKRHSLVRLTLRGDALLQLLVKDQLVEVTRCCIGLSRSLKDVLQMSSHRD